MPQSSLTSWLKKTTSSKNPPQSSSSTQLTHLDNHASQTPQTTTSPTSPDPQPTNHDRNAQDADLHNDTPANNPDTKSTIPHASTTQPTLPSASSNSFLRALHPTLPALPAPVSFAPMTTDSMNAFRRLNALLLPIPYAQDFYDEILADPVSNAITLLAFWDPKVTAADPAAAAAQSTTPQSTEERQEADEHRDTSTAGTPPRTTPPPSSILVAGLRCRIHPHPLTPSRPSPMATSLSSTTKQSTSSPSNPQPPILYISTLTLLPTYRHYGIATHLFNAILARAIQRYGITAVTAHVWEANEEGRAWYKARGFVEERRVEEYYRRLRPSGAVVVRREVRVGDWVGEG